MCPHPLAGAGGDPLLPSVQCAPFGEAGGSRPGDLGRADTASPLPHSPGISVTSLALRMMYDYVYHWYGDDLFHLMFDNV